jgi:hypothetical protein
MVGSGNGLVQVSTVRLVGRKLCVWGQSAGELLERAAG